MLFENQIFGKFSENVSDIYKLCNEMKLNGLVSKPIGSNALRFSPPLIITEAQLREGIDIIVKSINEYSN